MFIDNYVEYMERDEEGNMYKVIEMKNHIQVFEYLKNKLFCHVDATCKFDQDLKFTDVRIVITEIEIFDERNVKNMNLMEVKNSLFRLYKTMKMFFEVKILKITTIFIIF